MSSYLSSEYKIVQPQPLLNTALIVNTLDGLQSKYDQNKAMVDATISKYESLRGLSDMDNEYTAGRVKEAESAIENYRRGGANLAFGSVRDSMLTAFEGVANDPIVQNGIQQKVKFDNLNAEVAKRKEKNDGTYNDMNYTDALEQGGYQAYMQGKTKSLGTLKYHNYSDVNGKLAKQAADYSKQMAEEKLSTRDSNSYYTTNTYGKQLTQTEIYNHLVNSLDENDKEQMRINARQSLGKMTKESFNEKFLPQVQEELDLLKTNKSGIEAKIKSEKNSVELEKLKLQLVNTDSNITSKKQQLDTKDINIYDTYNKNILGGVAGDYDVNSVTKIDVDDINMRVKKFEYDIMNGDREYALKVATENRLTLKDAQEQADKTKSEEYNLIDKKQVKEDEKPSNEILDDEHTKSYEDLKSYLIAKETGFSDKSQAEQNAYMISMIPSGDVTKQNLIREFKQSLTGKVEIIQQTVDKLTYGAKEFYTSVKEGTKLQNLKIEMPFTVGLLQSKKKYENLTELEKAGVTLEASSNANYHIYEGEESVLVASAIDTMKKKIIKNGGNESKKILNTVNTSKTYKKEFKQPTTYSGGAGGYGYPTGSGTVTKYNSPFQPFTSDTNLSELGTFDNDSSKDVSKIYEGLGILNGANKTADKYKPNLMSQKALILTTRNKNEKEGDLARLAASAVQATPEYKNLRMPENNDVQISRNGDGYTIELDVVNNENKTIRKSFPITTLPDKLNSVLQTSRTQWNSSLENKKAYVPSFKYNKRNRVEAIETFNILAEERKDLISRQTRIDINNGQIDGSKFKSDETIEEYFSVDNFPNLTDKQKNLIKETLDSSYEIKYENKDSALEGTIYKNGQRQITYQSDQTKIDDGALNLESMFKLYEFKLNNIEKSVYGRNK